MQVVANENASKIGVHSLGTVSVNVSELLLKLFFKVTIPQHTFIFITKHLFQNHSIGI